MNSKTQIALQGGNEDVYDYTIDLISTDNYFFLS